MSFFDQFPEQSFQAKCSCGCIRAFHHANSGRCRIEQPLYPQKKCQCPSFEVKAA